MADLIAFSKAQFDYILFVHGLGFLVLATVFIPALLPIPLPLKIFVITAGVLRTPVRSFVAVIVAARAIRYYGEA